MKVASVPRARQAAMLAIFACIAASNAAHAAQTNAAADGDITSCERLRSFHDEEVVIVSAEEIEPSTVDTQTSPRSRTVKPYCRVEGHVDGSIGFELWLPQASEWHGRFLGAGVGGSGGRYNLSELARGVDQGFAAITTDSGHKASDVHWMLDRKKAQDYAHRAEHRVAVAGKAIVAAYYGRPAKHAYFIGCSGGGRKALIEMQRYPDDYDGIVAGAPGTNLPASSARHLWVQLLELRSPHGPVSDASWNLLSNAVLAQCDRLDGVSDGVLEDPRECRFDLDSLACKQESSNASCIDAGTLELMRAIVAPLTDEEGRRLDPGLLPGVRNRPGGSTSLAAEMIGQLVKGDPDWDKSQFVMARDTPAIGRVLPELLAEQTDLTPFAERGGKALIYQGWLDPSVRAQQTIGWFEEVERVNGGRTRTQAFIRLFMAPGVGHCRGGAGPDRFGGASSRPVSADPMNDMLSAVVAWVEEGRAPQQIVASKLQGEEVVRTRPLCPYPQKAHYRGRGDTNIAANFTCR